MFTCAARRRRLGTLLASACTDDGVPYLTRVSDEQTGANCSDGGQKLEFGADGDAVLSDTEITASAFVRKGAASRGALVTNTPLAQVLLHEERPRWPFERRNAHQTATALRGDAMPAVLFACARS